MDQQRRCAAVRPRMPGVGPAFQSSLARHRGRQAAVSADQRCLALRMQRLGKSFPWQVALSHQFRRIPAFPQMLNLSRYLKAQIEATRRAIRRALLSHFVHALLPSPLLCYGLLIRE
jgi:hypothetical protein